MAYRDITKPDRSILKEYMKDHTNKEAAAFFGVDPKTIARWLKSYNLDYIKLKYGENLQISEMQHNLLEAGLLGDGTMRCHKAGTAQFSMKQRLDRQEYVQWYYDQLQPFSINILQDAGKCSNGVVCEAIYQYTCFHPLLYNYYERWYEDRIKRIPNNFSLNLDILVHWYIQDGHNHWSRKNVRLNTQCFTYQEVEYLVDRLYKDLNIKAEISGKKQFIIEIYSGGYFDFIELVKNNVIWECFKFKIDTSKVKSTKPGWGASKLKNHASEIRSLFHSGNYSRKDLADRYQVTISTISNIVNNVTYYDPNYRRSRVGGTALVEVFRSKT